jgi:hypothetical protein
LEIATLMAAIVAVFFTYQTFTKVQIQAIAAQRQANSMRDQLRVSIESFRTDERAWIEFDPIKSPRVIPKATGFPWTGYRYELYPKNIGKTAAYDFVVRGEISASTIELSSNVRGMQMIQDGLFKDNTSGARVLMPTTPIPKVLAPYSIAAAPFVLVGTEAQYGRIYSFLVGRVDYSDVFGIAHWMKFCMVIVGNGTLRYCEVGNDEDRNPEIKPK